MKKVYECPRPAVSRVRAAPRGDLAEVAAEALAYGGNGWQNFGKISAKFRSFSAVSKRNFASKYAFDSIFQNLPDYLAEFFEIWQYFADSATFAIFLLNFNKNC